MKSLCKDLLLIISALGLLLAAGCVPQTGQADPTHPPEPTHAAGEMPDTTEDVVDTPVGSSSETSEISPTDDLSPTFAGVIFVITESELFKVNLACEDEFHSCKTDWIQLTTTPGDGHVFAAEFLNDQITASPDGTYVVFAFRLADEFDGSLSGGWDLYKINVGDCEKIEGGCTTEDFERLTGDPYDELSPTWSPIDDRIVFVSNQGPFEPFLNSKVLLEMGADGSNVKQFLSNEEMGTSGNFSNPSWSLDGTKVLFNFTDSEFQHPDTFIFSANSDGQDIEVLTHLEHTENENKMDLGPRSSPEGDLILFESNREPAGIYLIDISNGEISNLIVGSSLVSPQWTAESYIVFLSDVGLQLFDPAEQKTHMLLSSESAIRAYYWMP